MGHSIQRWGVEIEGYGLKREVVAKIVEDVTDDVCVVRNDNRASSLLHWAVVHDGSINRPREFELRTPVMTGEESAWDRLRVVCQALRQAGAQVGITCGLHVHHDASLICKAVRREFSPYSCNQIVMTAGWGLYARMERVLDTLVPPSRRENNNQNCVSLRKTKRYLGEIPCLDVIEGESGVLSFGGGAWSDHHSKLSVTALNMHDTLEYRQHAGTLNVGKIIPWIKLTGLIQHKIAAIALGEEPLPDEKTINTLDKLLDYVDAHPRLRRYYTKRQADLAAIHSSGNCKCAECAAIASTGAARLAELAHRYTQDSSGAWTPIENVEKIIPLWTDEAAQRFTHLVGNVFWERDTPARRGQFERLMFDTLGESIVFSEATTRPPRDNVPEGKAVEDLVEAYDQDYRDGGEAPYMDRTKRSPDTVIRPAEIAEEEEAPVPTLSVQLGGSQIRFTTPTIRWTDNITIGRA